MRPQYGPQHVRGGLDIGHPVAHRFVDRILERARSTVDTDDRGAEHAHAKHIQRLTTHIFRAHVDHALDAHERARRRGRDAVLSGAGLGHHSALAHARREQDLPHRVVDLVGAGVREVLAFEEEPHGRALRRASRFIQRRRPAHVVAEQTVQLREKARVFAGGEVGRRQLVHRLHQRLGNVPAPKSTEVSSRIGIAAAEHGPRGN